MKINKSVNDKMIKEEFQKMLVKKKLSTRLSQINEELGKMSSEDSLLNEVEAGGQTKVSSHAWTGKENGDVKWDAKFEKIGTHLKEDEMPGEEPEMEMGAEMNAEPEMEMGEFEAKFAEIGRAIDAKMSSESNGETVETSGEEAMEMGAEGGENSDDDFEEVEVSDDDNEEVEVDESMGHSVGAEQHLTPKTPGEMDKPTNDLKGHVQQESVDEPLEGHSVVQDAAADDVNDNMEKDTHVKEGANKKGAVITEAKKSEGKNIFTEGLDPKKKTALLEEMNRMKKFAGLSKDEE